MNRETKELKYRLEGSHPVTDPVQDIQERAAVGPFTFFLAHAHDGVIWGRVEDGSLKLSSDAFPSISPKLRTETLQQARLFGPQGEVFWWPGEGGWLTRQIVDGVAEGVLGDVFEEALILWGTNDEGTQGGFTLLREADLGIRQAVPVKPSDRRSLKLIVRHYLDYDEAGAIYVKLSRLVDVCNGGVE